MNNITRFNITDAPEETFPEHSEDSSEENRSALQNAILQTLQSKKKPPLDENQNEEVASTEKPPKGNEVASTQKPPKGNEVAPKKEEDKRSVLEAHILRGLIHPTADTSTSNLPSTSTKNNNLPSTSNSGILYSICKFKMFYMVGLSK